MKVLVIGGPGWVGHHVARKVAERGHAVTVLSRGTKGRFNPPEGADLVRADKNDAEAFRKLLDGMDVDAVMDSVPSETSLKVIIETLSGRIRHYIH